MKPILKIFFLLGSLYLVDLNISFLIATHMTLRKRCAYSVFFWSVFFRIRTEYGEILRKCGMQNAECGKIQTRKTPNTDTSRSVCHELKAFSCDIVIMILFFLNEFVYVIYVLKEFIFLCVYVKRSKDFHWSFKSTFPDLKHLTHYSSMLLFYTPW